jgi:hypothetical protein
VRTAVWLYLVCAFIVICGVFLPAGQMSIGPKEIARHESVSLYGVANSKDTVRKTLEKYRGSTAKAVGAVVLGKVAPHLKGKVRSGASDVQDAMDALDSLKDEDVDKVGTIVSAVMWTLLALQVITAILLFSITAATSRLRLAAAFVATAISAAIGVAILLVLQRVVLEANKEIELEMFSLRVGAYLIPFAACAGFAAVIATIILYARERASLARRAAA